MSQNVTGSDMGADAEREAIRLQERERIAQAIEHEASVTPCQEDANVIDALALLVRANFSYDDADAYEDQNVRLTADRDAALAKVKRLRDEQTVLDRVIYRIELGGEPWSVELMEARDAAVFRVRTARAALAGTSETGDTL